MRLTPWLILLVLLDISLHAVEPFQKIAHRIEAHWRIHDPAAALAEARQALLLFPTSPEIRDLYLLALAKAGNERELLQALQDEQYKSSLTSDKRDLLEEIAWSILVNSSRSSVLLSRKAALIGASSDHSLTSVKLICQGMHDANYSVRALAVSSAALPEDKLTKEVIRLFHTEKNWKVRKAVIKAIATLKIHSLKPHLEKLIADSNTSHQERLLAISALVSIQESANRDDLNRWLQSDRAGMRLLACMAIGRFTADRDIDILLKLSSDPHPTIRAAALQTIGQIRPQQATSEITAIARQHLQDQDLLTRLSAAWLLLLYEPQQGFTFLHPYLYSQDKDERLLAAAVIRGGGANAIPLAQYNLAHHSDPYVKMTLALGLIGQRQAVSEAMQALNDGLSTQKDFLSEREWGLFHAIAPHESSEEEDAQLSDRQVRLDILNTLAMLGFPQAQASIRQFLIERPLGISFFASAVLLQEGDEEAIRLVQELLNDPANKVRIQAALILALWSRDEGAIETLENAYQGSSREIKAIILESLGNLGSMRSVPFLLDTLQDQSASLRAIAAMALIQCLNH